MAQQYPEPTVGALIFNKNGEIFLMKSHKWKGLYVIPGGHIELGESAEAAVKREIKEETSLDVFDVKFLQFQEFIYDKTFWKKKHFIFLDYTCKTKSIKVKLNDEGQGYVWVSLSQALRRPIEPYTRRVIRAFAKTQP